MAIHRKESNADVYFVLIVIVGLIVSAYYLGRVQAEHEVSSKICKSRSMMNYKECMQNKPWEAK